MKMKVFCSPTAQIHQVPYNRLFSVSLSAAQSNPNHLFNASFQDKKWKKSNNPLRLSCIASATKPAMVTGKAWDKLILHSETPVLVEFYASWCGPCRMVHRVIEEISQDYAGSLNCFVLDADKDIAVAENYDIKAVPVVLLFKNGVKCDSIIGTMPKEFYAAAVERVLAS